MEFEVDGDPVEPGFVKIANVQCLLKGKTRTEYEGHEPYEASGFWPQQCPLHPDKQVNPQAKAVSTVLEDALYFCATAKENKKLDFEYKELKRGEEFTFVGVRTPTYVVPVQGRVKVGNETLDPFEIGAREEPTAITLKATKAKTIVYFIWER